jgi:hypothetical protein
MAANLYDYLMSQQPTAAQSIMSALPFYNLPKKQAGYFAPAQRALNASINPDDPMYQKIYGQQKLRGQQNLAEVIAEAMRQNRKAGALGRTPLFSAERGGEEIFRNLSRGYLDTQNNAADQTQNILGTAAQGYGNMAGIQSQFAANKAGIKGNLLGGLAKLFGL